MKGFRVERGRGNDINTVFIYEILKKSKLNFRKEWDAMKKKQKLVIISY